MSFTPLESFTGGLVIGLSVVVLHLSTGRIAGISGMLSQLIRPRPSAWIVAFALGLPLGAWALRLASGSPPALDIRASTPLLIAAGLLVGFGTRLGSGCTSGHGICGLARFSPRSLAATCAFMGAGMLVASLAGRWVS